MPLKKYTEEQKNFIAENVKGRTAKELAALVSERFGICVSESKMKSYKTNHKLKSGTPCGKIAGQPTEMYPEHVKTFIQNNYIGTGHSEMAGLLYKMFGTSYTKEQMKSYYANHNMNSGLTGYFPKGHIPMNKGKKGTGGWEPTQFKKGHIPENYRPVGSERISVDGYIEIKVADPNKWRFKHQVVWEEANGKIPPGHAVIFGDGNSLNLDINNLVLVSRSQLAILNRKKLIQNDVELTKAGVIIADLYKAIKAAAK